MSGSNRLSRRTALRLSALGIGGAALATVPGLPSTVLHPFVAGRLAAQGDETPPAGPLQEIDPELLYPEPEGGTVVLDVNSYPTTFAQSPLLTPLVEAGTLPPVEERLPQREDLLVVKPLNEVGVYGGTIRRGFTGPGDGQNMGRFGGLDYFLFWDYRVENLIPNLAKGWELSSDYLTTTLSLRRGLKWSDGQPVTADDIMFWHDDVWNNPELVPQKSVHMAVATPDGTAEGTIVKVDDFTVRYEFAAPYASFPEQLANLNPVTGPSKNWQLNGVSGGIMPAHYMQQFHPKYTDQARLDQLAQDAGLDGWVALFQSKHVWNINPELPVLTPWRVTSPINTSTWVYERNPYFWAVNTAGNQLPYIDSIVLTLAENIEVLNLRAIAGEYDYQDRHVQLSKLPVFLENRERGDYRVHLNPASFGMNVGVVWNHSYDADPEVAKWILDIDFRKALSMGIDRDQINEAFFLGLGQIGSGVPEKTNPYYPGDEWARPEWFTLDVAKAGALLDQIGLTEKDGDGYRLRSDGGGRLTLQFPCNDVSFLPLCQIGEMLIQHWRQIGIYAEAQSMAGTQQDELKIQNQLQFILWETNSSEVLFQQAGNYIPVNFPNDIGPEISQWFDTDGEEGTPPPAGFEMERVVELWRQGRTVPLEERAELGKEIWRIYVEKVWHLPFVGLAPGTLGVHAAKTGLGNVPRRVVVSSGGQTPGNSRSETFYWKG